MIEEYEPVYKMVKDDQTGKEYPTQVEDVKIKSVPSKSDLDLLQKSVLRGLKKYFPTVAPMDPEALAKLSDEKRYKWVAKMMASIKLQKRHQDDAKKAKARAAEEKELADQYRQERLDMEAEHKEKMAAQEAEYAKEREAAQTSDDAKHKEQLKALETQWERNQQAVDDKRKVQRQAMDILRAVVMYHKELLNAPVIDWKGVDGTEEVAQKINSMLDQEKYEEIGSEYSWYADMMGIQL